MIIMSTEEWWYEGLKYTAAHFTGGVGPMRMYDEDN